MKFKPHDYQRYTIQFIIDHPESAIFLGMGMGKTISTLTAINDLIRNRFETQRVLVIAPIRVARDTWPAEIHKWDHLEGLAVSPIIGTAKQRQDAANRRADIYTIGRENIPWLVKHHGNRWPYDMVVIDELSSFKNPQAKRFKALKKVRPKIQRIVGLTGTPAPNSLLDIWAPFRLIDNGQRLGKYITHYRDQYFTPGRRNGAVVYNWNLRPGADQAIYDNIADITVSMRTTDYLQLPEATHQHITVQLPAKARKHIDTLKRDLVLDLDDDTIDAANAATLSLKLQQLAGGAIYNEEGNDYITIHNEKIQALAELVDQAQGNPILVCYWFKHERDRILNSIPGARVLDTQRDFECWNAGLVPVALIHPASAGHGLNLQDGGHIMVWYTTPWSLELYEQANARLHRQGQTEPVSIIHIDTADSIDQTVHQALTRKDTTQQALITAVKAQLEEAA
ncbi:DEAD/DEAH box helicase [Corynebacterium minutissimum]|uniref:Phage-associated protein n=1 Tax=Corynebacterium minutissimum TaxID=38301 RepID=A0A376CWI4_9CORY|nr:DEAD/DEAH box helicase [Corynebacterium minutissimum]QRP60580.1 DEAD/DEAH box helicase [Corynebacterium minutissimum]STC76390.1 phage-associated protein [Corynebacterium minutissimum]